MKNDLIKELVEQAGFYMTEKNGQALAQFAELIVKECMSVADLPNDVSGKWDHLLPSQVIKEHFGVEQ